MNNYCSEKTQFNELYVSYTGKTKAKCFLIVIYAFRIFHVSVYRTLNSRKIHNETLAYPTEDSGSKHNTCDMYSVASNLA